LHCRRAAKSGGAPAGCLRRSHHAGKRQQGKATVLRGFANREHTRRLNAKNVANCKTRAGCSASPQLAFGLTVRPEIVPPRNRTRPCARQQKIFTATQMLARFLLVVWMEAIEAGPPGGATALVAVV
jgi:hypothetical protein